MCTIAVKKFKDVGFIGVKNRDRNYKPNVNIKQSFRNDNERILLWDETSKWTEGVNKHGICILSAATATKKDEKVGLDTESSVIYKPDGKAIRVALLEKTIKDALNVLIKSELSGNTFIFNKNECILMESGYTDGTRSGDEFIYKTQTIKESAARTNHGLLLPQLGYDFNSEDPHELESAKSSKERLNTTLKLLSKIKLPNEMLSVISDTSNINPQLNPLRISKTHGKTIMVTTGQIQLTPNDLILSYRPIWCNMKFNFDNLDSPNTSTYFEIISKRGLITNNIKESFDTLLQKAYKDLLNG